MTPPSQASIDSFIDALWLEEGLSKNTLAAYRRDLSLYAAWLHGQGRALDTTGESDLNGYFAARHSQIAGELSELARRPHRIDGDHQSRLVVERLQRGLDVTDARSQQLIVTGDEIEARRREFLVLE